MKMQHQVILVGFRKRHHIDDWLINEYLRPTLNIDELVKSSQMAMEKGRHPLLDVERSFFCFNNLNSTTY